MLVPRWRRTAPTAESRRSSCRPHPNVRGLGALRLLRLSRPLRPRYAFATEGNASAGRPRRSLRRFTPPPPNARVQRQAGVRHLGPGAMAAAGRGARVHSAKALVSMSVPGGPWPLALSPKRARPGRKADRKRRLLHPRKARAVRRLQWIDPYFRFRPEAVVSTTRGNSGSLVPRLRVIDPADVGAESGR